MLFCFGSKLGTSPIFVQMSSDLVSRPQGRYGKLGWDCSSSLVLTGCVHKLVKHGFCMSYKWYQVWPCAICDYNWVYFDMMRCNFQFLTAVQNLLPYNLPTEYVWSYTSHWDVSFLNITGLILRLNYLAGLHRQHKLLKVHVEVCWDIW